MYVLEMEAMKLTCHRTISPEKPDGKPCKGGKCSAWDTVQTFFHPCPACGHQTVTDELEPDAFGRCTAKWRHS